MPGPNDEMKDGSPEAAPGCEGGPASGTGGLAQPLEMALGRAGEYPG